MSKKKGESFGKQLLRSAAKQFRIKEKEPKRPYSKQGGESSTSGDVGASGVGSHHNLGSSSTAKQGTSRSNDAGAGSEASGSGPSSPQQGTSRRNDPRTWSGASDSSEQVHHEEGSSSPEQGAAGRSNDPGAGSGVSGSSKQFHCDQVPLYRELEDKVNQLEQEVKSMTMEDVKPEPSTVEPFDVKTCRTKLAEYYQRTATVPTSVWSKASLVDIHEIYTRLSWVKQEQTPAGPSQSELTHYIDLFTANKNGVVPKRILVQGQTGIGKSTFVKKLAVDWAELDDEKTGDEQTASLRTDDEFTSFDDYEDRSKTQTDALRKFELVVAVNLKEVCKCQSLKDVISNSSIFADEDKSLTEDLLTYITNNQEKVLLVFDSYDEYHSGRNSEIYDIFKGKKLRNCCVLITTRNSKADELREFKDLHAEITGFSFRDMNVFMRRILGSREQAENLLHHLEKKRLEDLAKVPLLLLFFCTLWKNGQLKSFPKTKTKLYMAIVQYVLDHTQGKHSPRRSGKVHDFKEILVEIGKVALEGLLKDDHVFDYDELSAAIRCQESFIIGLLQVTEYTESLRPAGMVSFIHKSIQEFVAAWYITYVCIPEGNLGPVEKHARSLEDCQALENVFQFVCGLTDEGAAKVFKHMDFVRISDSSLNLSTVPDVDVPLCNFTERHWKFNDFVLDSFQEVQSKAELSKPCFDCVGGIILGGSLSRELPFVNDLKSWSIDFSRGFILFLARPRVATTSCN